jgi:hypothetical protein
MSGHSRCEFIPRRRQQQQRQTNCSRHRQTPSGCLPAAPLDAFSGSPITSTPAPPSFPRELAPPTVRTPELRLTMSSEPDGDNTERTRTTDEPDSIVTVALSMTICPCIAGHYVGADTTTGTAQDHHHADTQMTTATPRSLFLHDCWRKTRSRGWQCQRAFLPSPCLK